MFRFCTHIGAEGGEKGEREREREKVGRARNGRKENGKVGGAIRMRAYHKQDGGDLRNVQNEGNNQ